MRISFSALLLATVLAAPTVSAASEFNVYGNGKYGLAGCGFGSLIFGPKPGPVQIVAATFNATSGSQTFGITTGTSNCGRGLFQAEQRNFLDNNLATLKKESAQGHGDTVVAYATLLGCDTRQVGEFEAALQSHHGQVFAAADSASVLDQTRDVVVADPALRQTCWKVN